MKTPLLVLSKKKKKKKTTELESMTELVVVVSIKRASDYQRGSSYLSREKESIKNKKKYIKGRVIMTGDLSKTRNPYRRGAGLKPLNILPIARWQKFICKGFMYSETKTFTRKTNIKNY